ncbi:MAG: TonB-dependent receptor [Bacteroidota bacterium]
MKKVVMLMTTLLLSIILEAQVMQVRGLVTDSDTDEPLIGASIEVVGTSDGTVTDIKGRFAIELAANESIRISYIGYESQIIDKPDEQITIALKSNYQLEQLIVRGVRASGKDPITRTDISTKQIKENYVGQHPIFLLEQLSPSITSFSESGTSVGNYGQIRMRGIGQERINFTLNGVPLNDMIDHGVFFSNITDISSSFNSIQVQRGVGTSAAGASSYAGSINFESFNVTGSSPFSQVQLGAGSFGTYRANFAANSGVNEKGFGFYSAISRLWSDGYKRNTSTDATSVFLTGGYFGEKDMVRVTAFAGRSENGLGYYTIDQSILDNDPRFNNLTENDRDDFEQYLVQLQYNREFNERSSWNSTVYYGGAGGDFREGTPDVDSVFVENYFLTQQTSFFSYNFPLKNDHYGLISNYYYEDGKWDLSAGLHAYAFRRENRQSVAPDDANPFYEDQTEKDELALFARARYKASSKLELYGDLQFRTMSMTMLPDYDFIFGPNVDIAVDPLNDFNYQFFNPRIGLSYELSKRENLYMSLGRSGREPTRIDLIGGFTLNADALGLALDPQFEAEYVNNLELGYKLNGQRLFLAANLFYMDFENEIAPIGEIIAFGVQRRVNITDSYRAGLELEWNAILTPTISYVGNLTAMDAEIREVTLGGDSFTNVNPVLTPNWIGNHTVQLKATKKLRFDLTVNHMSQSYMEFSNQDEFTVPGFYTIDLGVMYQFTDKVNARLMMNNALDRTYYTYGVPSDVDFSGTIEPGFLPQAPRNFFLATEFRF